MPELPSRSPAETGKRRRQYQRRLPGRFPLGFTVAQQLGEQVRRTPVRGRAGLRTASAAWRPEQDGPLGYLAGHRPLLSLAITDFWLVFGRSAEDRAKSRARSA